VAEKKTAEKPDDQQPEKVDDLPEVKAAAEAIRRAEEELQKACQTYQSLRREATAHVRKLRESSVGEVVDGTLQTVRKHPALGIGLAALLGFFLGRLFRR